MSEVNSIKFLQNFRSDLLPNIKLGWQIFDTCDNSIMAITEALQMVAGFIDSTSRNISTISGW